jgi:hypothetical protein
MRSRGSYSSPPQCCRAARGGCACHCLASSRLASESSGPSDVRHAGRGASARDGNAEVSLASNASATDTTEVGPVAGGEGHDRHSPGVVRAGGKYVKNATGIARVSSKSEPGGWGSGGRETTGTSRSSSC